MTSSIKMSERVDDGLNQHHFSVMLHDDTGISTFGMVNCLILITLGAR